MAKYDFIESGFDLQAIKALSGYQGHRVIPEGDGKGGIIAQWLEVDGVTQEDLDAAMSSYDPVQKAAEESKAQAASDLEATNPQMFDIIETIIANTPGLRAKLPQEQQNLLTQRETLRAQL